MHCTVFAPLLSATISVVSSGSLACLHSGARSRRKRAIISFHQNQPKFNALLRLAGLSSTLTRRQALAWTAAGIPRSSTDRPVCTHCSRHARALGMTRHDLAIQRMADTTIHHARNRLFILSLMTRPAQQARVFVFSPMSLSRLLVHDGRSAQYCAAPSADSGYWPAVRSPSACAG